MMRKTIFLTIFAAALLIAAAQESAIRYGVSKTLISQAWSLAQKSGHDIRPWPWLDSHPVAVLDFPGRGQDMVVMSGDSNAVMAFAPLWHDGSHIPGEKGISLISGDGRTHFSVIRHLRPEDAFTLTTRDNDTKTYKVEDIRIVDQPGIEISNAEGSSILVLSTAYTLSNGADGEKLKLVVIARELKEADAVRLAGL